MSNTKIVLNRQSDLILDNAEITAPVGIVLADIAGAPEAIAAEELLRIAGDTELTENLVKEEDARIAAVSTEVSARIAAVSTEVSARIAAVSALDTKTGNDMNAEVSARIAGDANLQNQIDNVLSNVDGDALDSLTEIVGAFQAADDDLNGAITLLANTASSALSGETEARIADVDAEQARAESAEASLYQRFHSEIGMSVDSEESRAESAEDVLTADLSAEESRAMEAELSLETYVDEVSSNEYSRATSAEESLATVIAAEHSEHIANELSIVTAMDAADSAEMSARIAGDVALDAKMETAISNEASRATAAEGVLTSDLSSEIAARETAIDNEASARIDGDQSLQNQIDFITDNTDPAAIDSLTEIVAAFQSADGDINNAITTLADAAGANLSTEVARATSAEAVLTADLSAEASARIAADYQIGDRFDSVIEDMFNSDMILENAIIAEESNRIADVDAEESRAISAEGVLTSDLSTEASRATAAEAGLTSDLSTEVSARAAAVSTETSARIADVDAEESRAMAAELVLTNDLSSEVANRGTAVNAEASYRVAGDLSLQNQIDFITENIDPVAIDSLTEIVAAFQNADGDINGAISELADAAGANLSTEVARAESAELVLTNDLSAEVSARIADVDAEESARIAAVSAEASTARAAEGSIATNLSAEVEARISDVDAEQARAESVEAELSSDLSSEESRAIAAEGVLTSDLSTEESARITAVSAEASTRFAEDTKLTENLNTEISNRGDAVDNEEYRATTAEASLAADLSSEVAARGTAVDAEASYRVSGDLSLQNQIDFITSNVDAAAIDSLTEIVSAFQSADGDINNAITTLADAAGANLSTEVERAESAEAVLTADLSSEVAAREAAVSALDTKTTNAMTAEVSNRIADVDAEESRAMSAEASLLVELINSNNKREELESEVSTEVSAREAAMSAEESMRVEADASIAAELSSDIEALADVDGTTIVLNGDTNQIELAETVAAPASGTRTFNGEVTLQDITVNGDIFSYGNVSIDFPNGLIVGGVDVMAEISSEISRAEAAEASIAEELSSEVSYLIANTDLGSIDSFAEIVSDLSSEVERAESAEASMTAIYAKHVGIEAPNGTKTLFVLGTPVRTGSELVYLNGLLLTPSEDYTMNGNDVEFSIAPAATDRISAYGVC